MSPTQRTLRHLRRAGYPLVQVVERWNPYAKVRLDLFGIIDVVAVGADIVGVQATSGSNVSARVRKLTDSPPFRSCGRPACGCSCTAGAGFGGVGRCERWTCHDAGSSVSLPRTAR